jgi:hypothetical protein
VRFDRAVGPKQWGDPPFTVSASAMPGARVSYSASGACRLAGTRTVQIVTVGSCAIQATASASGSASVVAALSVSVARARPVIHFGDRTVAFFRPFALNLGATSSPVVPLAYRVVASNSMTDRECTVTHGILTFSPRSPMDSFTPSILPIACLIEVSAAQSSPNYIAPTPVRGLIQVNQPVVQIRMPAVGPISWKSLGSTHRFVVTIHEDSGDIYGFDGDAESLGSDGSLCSLVSLTPPTPVPAGTTEYHMTLTLANPGTGSYTCRTRVEVYPMSHAVGGWVYYDLKVVP